MKQTHTLPAEAKILIAGIVRDSGKQITRELKRVPNCFSDFKDYRLMVVESDSTDDTAHHIQRVCVSHPRVIAQHLGTLSLKIPDKIERIAHCRNIYLKAFQEDPAYRDFDYLAVIDLDGACKHLTKKAVRSCWNMTLAWDAVTCNRKDRYTDLYALRHHAWQPGDCWQDYENLKKTCPEPLAMQLAITSKMIELDENTEPFHVDSAFCGLAIYTKEALEGASYSAFDSQGNRVCEHVALHNTIRQKGLSIVLNPKLTVYMKRDNNPLNSLRRLWVKYFP